MKIRGRKLSQFKFETGKTHRHCTNSTTTEWNKKKETTSVLSNIQRTGQPRKSVNDRSIVRMLCYV